MRRMLLLAAIPLAAETPDEILGRVAKAYGSMKAVHMVATIETIYVGGGGNQGSSEAELEYAAKGQGKVRATRKTDGALMISSGDMTWKALASTKEYMALETAASEGDAEEEESDERRKDFVTAVRSDIFGQLNPRFAICVSPKREKKSSTKQAERNSAAGWFAGAPMDGSRTSFGSTRNRT